MTQSELNQRVEEQAARFGGSGVSKRDLLYAAAMLNIPGRSQMTLDELSSSIVKALQQGVDDQIRPALEPVARMISVSEPGTGRQADAR